MTSPSPWNRYLVTHASNCKVKRRLDLLGHSTCRERRYRRGACSNSREHMVCKSFHLAVGLTDVIWPRDSETRGSFVAQRRLPCTESHSPNTSSHSGWPTRRFQAQVSGSSSLYPLLGRLWGCADTLERPGTGHSEVLQRSGFLSIKEMIWNLKAPLRTVLWGRQCV